MLDFNECDGKFSYCVDAKLLKIWNWCVGKRNEHFHDRKTTFE